MINFTPTDIPGLLALAFDLRADARGHFVKTFHADAFSRNGLEFVCRESYYSMSNRNVLRGFHFQVPPHAHDKIVCCAEGVVLDVVIDLRRDSLTYGRCVAREFNDALPSGFLIPAGCGHAFLTLSERARLLYYVTSVYAMAQDAGVAWNGVGFDWPVSDPILSERDRSFPRFSEFESPFH